MRINHNIAALNTFNQLSKNSEIGNSALAKLSSGLRINTAADDPAGLSISEKMRSQIRGLDQATSNAQDGISLIQTAEGALNESTAILQRMRELGVQAGNDTATTGDRQNIQDEMNQLAKEITRIADSTKFNGQTLMGSLSQFSGNFMIGSDAGQNLSVSIGAMDAVTLGIGTNATTNAAVDEVATVSGDGNEFVGVVLGGYTQELDLDIKIEVTAAGVNNTSGATANVTINGVTRALTSSNTGATAAAAPVFTLDSADFGDIFESGQQIVIAGGNTPVATDEVNIKINGRQNGIAALAVDSNTHAGTAVTAIDSAIQDVSNQRSQLGAFQNRLEHTIDNLGTASENLTAAESRIRDVDMADEMVEYTKMNILTSAAQSMLAQAIQAPQSVLQLLQ